MATGTESFSNATDTAGAQGTADVLAPAHGMTNDPAASGVAPVPRVLRHYRRLASLPLGRWLFARLVCRNAPYFATIKPRFLELRPGLCQVALRKRRAVQNHIKTVHAIAMANLCELAGGMLMEVSIPTSMRWIPRGMTIEYLKKAETGVTATARLDKSEWTVGNVGVPVSVTDNNGVEVVRAVITMYVSGRQR